MSKKTFINTHSAAPTEDDFVSRSAQKREADEVHRLAEGLTALKASEYATLKLDEELEVALNLARKITSHIAKRRQILFVAKLLRSREELLDGFRIVIDKPKSELKKQTALMHRAERWRDRLLQEGDKALSAFVDEHPQVDRQLLRSLQRSAQQQIKANEASEGQRRDNGSFSALYKLLHQTMKLALAPRADDSSPDDLNSDSDVD